MAHYLKLCCLSVQLAVGEEESKHVNPHSNISSCLIYIFHVSLSLVLVPFLTLCPVISRPNSTPLYFISGRVMEVLLRSFT